MTERLVFRTVTAMVLNIIARYNADAIANISNYGIVSAIARFTRLASIKFNSDNEKRLLFRFLRRNMLFDGYKPFTVVKNAIAKLETQGIINLADRKDLIAELITFSVSFAKKVSQVIDYFKLFI